MIKYYSAEVIGKVRKIALLNGTQYVGLLSATPGHSNFAKIFDLNHKCIIYQIEMSSYIVNIALSYSLFVIAEYGHANILDWTNKCSLIHQVELVPNKGNNFALCTDKTKELFAYVSEPGHISVLKSGAADGNITTLPLTFVPHNKQEIGMINLNDNGTLLVSTTKTGMEIKIFDPHTGSGLYTFKRGITYATIKCMNFSSDSRHLFVSSNKGSGHVFELSEGARVGSSLTLYNMLWGLKAKYVVDFSKQERIMIGGFINEKIPTQTDNKKSTTKDNQQSKDEHEEGYHSSSSTEDGKAKSVRNGELEFGNTSEIYLLTIGFNGNYSKFNNEKCRVSKSLLGVIDDSRFWISEDMKELCENNE
uniref:WD_REPEATS_REGION domain-containing protein n=1 Tax=Rhabditophanes sp. KR3021 TaxID=114890 RepID=A0AC35TZ22_9BILA